MMNNTIEDRYNSAAEFLVDTRELPPEMRCEIRGMIKSAKMFNFSGQCQLVMGKMFLLLQIYPVWNRKNYTDHAEVFHFTKP